MMRAEVIVSEGLYPQTKRPDPASRKLALGILLQAFRDIIAPGSSSNKEGELWREDAVEWFTSDSNDPGSFKWVCHILQVSPGKLQEWLTTYRRSNGINKRKMAQRLSRFQIPR